jgi:uncharacterized protein YkwD
MEKTFGEDRPRYRWLVVAAAAVLISVLAAGESGSAATSYDPEELQFLRLINEYRKENGAGPLILSDTLAVAAEHHSKDMAEYGFFAHNTANSSYYPAGSQPWDRMAAEGYDYNTIRGENLATGTETAEESFEAWRESPSHNAAMLDGRYRVIGIARVYKPGGRHAWYWTTDFGGALDPTSHAPGESPEPEESQEDQQSTGNDQPQKAQAQKQQPRSETEKPPRDGAEIENGAMNGGAVWEQKAKDGADLILDEGRARLGGYDDGLDDLSQKIRVGKETRLAYDVKIETAERRNPSDWMRVRITNEKGERVAVLRRYASGETEGWQRQKIDLSRFAGRTVYVSFRAGTDPSLLTTFYLDNVVLKRDSGPAAGP